MKILLALFVLLFSSSVFAEDISDFEIGGVSIGDSLLDHYTDKEILNPEFTYEYKNIPYKYFGFLPKLNSNYDFIQITIKVENSYITNSKKMIIHGVSGLIYSLEDMNDCYSKMLVIKKELESFFKISGVEDSGKRSNDTSGESTYKRYLLYINEKNNYSDASIICTDYSKIMENNGFNDVLNITMHSQELISQISLYEYK